MARYVLIPGAGSDGWFWHPVTERLVARGHRVLAVDPPWDDEAVTFSDMADRVVADLEAARAADGATDDERTIVVAQSLGGFVGPLVCARTRTDALVLVAAMVPTPGESAEDW